ncbi:MAG: hypothetical protein ACOVOR_02045 [Rhabdochlamydiaceae bacterium]
MNSKYISFFTPIQYRYYPISWRQRMIESIDAYFHLGGRVAIVLGPPDKDGKEPIQFQNSPFFCWQSVLKVMSYVSSFFSAIAAILFVPIVARSTIQVLAVLSSFPVLMLITKIALRATSRFYLPSQPQLSPESPESVRKNKGKTISSKEIASHTAKSLDAICYPSFFSRLKAVYYNKKAISNDDQQIWLSTVLELFLDAYIDDGCHPRVTWKESRDYCYDSLSIQQRDGTLIYRHDCLNDQQHHVMALSFKRALDELDHQEKAELAIACLSSDDQELTEKPYQCLTLLREITFGIQGRYGSKLLDLDCIDVKDLIYNKLKALLRANLDRINAESEVLIDPQFVLAICEQLITDLLSNAKIQEEQLLIEPHICLDFKWIKPNCLHEDEIKYISFCHANDLNSKNVLDEPYITDQPLKIAQLLNTRSFDSIKKSPEFKVFRQWIEKNYYNPFCSQWIRQLQPKQEVIQVKPKSKTSLRRVIPNDRFGDTYMDCIKNQFEIKPSWSFSGSCFLSTLFPEYEKNTQKGYEKLAEMRALISVKIVEQYQDYLNYVTVIPSFSQLDQSSKVKLKNEHWAIAEDDSLESKQKAIKAKAAQLLKSTTYLMEPEYELAAQLVNRPIWVYKRKAEKFFLDINSKLLPHVIYGENLSGTPCYLLDDYDHYKLLKPKKFK